MNKFSYKNLTPFKWFVLENFPFIEADFDALTEWQLFCKLGKEINKIIDSENTLGTQMENVTNAFIDLQNYVNNYFKNLDVQDEINNKLNEMAEDGTLQEIITQYLQVSGVLCYNTITDLKNATNLIEGSFARTFGKVTYNDGNGALYKIRTITSSDVVDEDNIISVNFSNTLIGEKQKNNDIINIQEDIEKIITNRKKYIFIGDSYGDGYNPDGNTTSWISLLVNKLNLTTSDFKSFHQGGLGFSTDRPNYSYNQLIENEAIDEEVTDVIVGGSYNDQGQSQASIISGITSFYNLCKTKFPNSTLHIAFIGWSKNGSRIQELATTYNNYKIGCEQNNIDFMQGTQYSLHNYYTDFASDDIHPTQNGQNKIAQSIYNCLKYGDARIFEKSNLYFDMVNGSTSNFLTTQILNNGIITTYIGPNTQDNVCAFMFSNPITLEGNTLVKIATINTGLIYGLNTNSVCLQSINCVVQLSDDSYTKVNLNLIIKEGDIYLTYNGASGSNYTSITIKAIQTQGGILITEGLLS